MLMTDLYTMGSLQPSLVRSRKWRSHGYSVEARKELVCTGDRHRCNCRRCKFYRHEHWGLRPLSSSEESSSEEEDQEKGYMLSRHYHGEYSCISPSSKRKFASSQIKQDFTRHTFSRHDDLSSYNEAGNNKCLTECDQEQEGSQTWNKYQPLSSSVHILAGQTIPQHGVDDELSYKSIQARCDRILDLLDPQHSRLMKRGNINPQGRNEEHGVWAGKEDTRNDVTSGMLHGGHTDREGKNSDEVDGTGPDVDFTMEVDNLGCEEVDRNRNDNREMDDTFLVKEDWDEVEQVTQGDGEFWWDNENFEEEMETQTMRQMKACFQSRSMDDGQGSEQEILLQEWYEIEELLGKDGEPLATEEDATDQGQRDILLAEWSLIEEELDADKVFSQHGQIYRRNDSEIMISKIQDIVNKARLDIQAVVKIALQDISDIQETHISSLDPVQRFLPGNICVTEGQFVQVMERPIMKCQRDQCPWKPAHNQLGIQFADYHREVRGTPSCTNIETEAGGDGDGLVKVHNASEDTLSTADPNLSTESEYQCMVGSLDIVFQGTIAGETSDANQCSLDEDLYAAAQPCS